MRIKWIKLKKRFYNWVEWKARRAHDRLPCPYTSNCGGPCEYCGECTNCGEPCIERWEGNTPVLK